MRFQIPCSIRTLAAAALIWSSASLPAAGQLQMPPRLAPAANRSNFQNFRDDRARFVLDYPKKDWIIAPGYGQSVVLFMQSRGQATVGVEFETLVAALATADIGSAFVNYELDDLKKTRPLAANFQSQLRESADGPLAVIEYTVPGGTGNQRVRQYTIPRGLAIYRIVCTAPTNNFPRFEPVFENMAATIRSAAAPAR